jgi:hypothetical protein
MPLPKKANKDEIQSAEHQKPSSLQQQQQQQQQHPNEENEFDLYKRLSCMDKNDVFELTLNQVRNFRLEWLT